MTETIHLDDLSEPRFSPEVTEIRDLMAGLAAACPLDSAALHAQATAETGLDDFGLRDYEERLAVLLAAFGSIDGLTPTGQVTVHAQLLQMLRNRLLLTERLRAHPEIHEIDLVAPVVIVGLPRTGTTHLHNLLAAGPTFRSLPYWESLEPLPLPGEDPDDPQPRIDRAAQGVWFADLAMPHFPLMHEMTATHVHEEIQLLANDFSTMFFETLGEVPAWRDHYLAHDQTPHYRYLRTQLQVLQHARGGRRWLLKSPQHLEQLPALSAVFPDAVTVVTHRDPASVVVSMATMVAYTARMHRDLVPCARIGRYWADRVHLLLTGVLRDRDLIPSDRSVDVRFDEFVADDLATAHRVYELAGEPVTTEAEEAMAAYLAGHARGRLGTIDYRAADVGLDPAELTERFADYTKRFL